MVLGIDIGGTNVKLGIVDEEYKIHKKYFIATEKDKGDIHFVRTIIEKAKKIKEDFDFRQIGIGSPGTIDSENGIAICAANLPYKDTPIVQMMQSAFEVPVKIANDADCAVYGELYAGVGRKYKDFFVITLGTGIGGGIVLNGQPYTGQRGRAGEFGHIIISYEGLECGCRKRGCYEQYASVTALIRQTKAAIRQNPESLLAQMGVEGVSGRTAFDAKRAGCPVGTAVVEQYIDYISIGIENLATSFQPEAIVIGGAISNEGQYLTEPLKKKITHDVDIVVSDLRNDAGLLGATTMMNVLNA